MYLETDTQRLMNNNKTLSRPRYKAEPSSHQQKVQILDPYQPNKRYIMRFAGATTGYIKTGSELNELVRKGQLPTKDFWVMGEEWEATMLQQPFTVYVNQLS